jgi:hypothetical protein
MGQPPQALSIQLAAPITLASLTGSLILKWQPC